MENKIGVTDTKSVLKASTQYDLAYVQSFDWFLNNENMLASKSAHQIQQEVGSILIHTYFRY